MTTVQQSAAPGARLWCRRSRAVFFAAIGWGALTGIIPAWFVGLRSVVGPDPRDWLATNDLLPWLAFTGVIGAVVGGLVGVAVGTAAGLTAASARSRSEARSTAAAAYLVVVIPVLFVAAVLGLARPLLGPDGAVFLAAALFGLWRMSRTAALRH